MFHYFISLFLVLLIALTPFEKQKHDASKSIQIILKQKAKKYRFSVEMIHFNRLSRF